MDIKRGRRKKECCALSKNCHLGLKQKILMQGLNRIGEQESWKLHFFPPATLLICSCTNCNELITEENDGSQYILTVKEAQGTYPRSCMMNLHTRRDTNEKTVR